MSGINTGTVLVLAGALLATWIMWRLRAYPSALLLGAFACLPAITLFRQVATAVSWPGLAVGLALLGWVGWQRRSHSAVLVTRWGNRARRKSGVASTLDIARTGSGVAMRRRTPIVRPSLLAGSRTRRLVQLLGQPVAQVAVQLCLVGTLRVWASIEDVVVAFGGPRVGKTQWLAGRVLDAPGAVLVTSTRTDLLEQTGPLRAQLGPVLVFNPVGLGDLPSTITFDPLTGCADPETAFERATDMLAAANRAGGGDREFWDDQARRNLAALMHAAALGEHTMSEIQTWLADLDRAEPRILALLRAKSPEPAYEAAVRQFIGTNERTRTSITSTIAPALGWLTHAPARAAALPERDGGHPFDVTQLLDTRATVYLLGGEEAQVAPLVCALTGYVAREARRLAAHQPGGRLDPPLSLRLDEAALICPIPLDRWSADMGGRGVSIVACFQSRAQLVDRYGEAKAAVILNNAGARLLFGGTADRDDLTYWSTLAGDRDEHVWTTDEHGHRTARSARRVPVLAPAQLANLPAGRVVAFRRGMPPVIGRAEQAWRRRDVHDHFHPTAITVRARAALTRHHTALGEWLATRARALAARLTRARATAGRSAQAATAGPGRWLAGLRSRITGGYTPPPIVDGHLADPDLGHAHTGEVIPFHRPGIGPADPPPRSGEPDDGQDDGSWPR
ncbi:type IV secretory system conjugative DNA transfer family protein [Pseudonocardia sp.]|uniref:type IV secretory system conjugative DNA transfer family protein n=1 Tax=Pseudonocardia sp. TaxID=60912 RepID=UPI003D0F279A